MKKRNLFFAGMAVLLMLGMVSALDFEVQKKTLNEIIIKEIGIPAIFEFTIKNLGQGDNFEIYSLLDVDFLPKGNFYIASGETKVIKIEIVSGETIKQNEGYFNFAYKIKNSEEKYDDRLLIKLVSLKNALGLWTDNINPDDTKTKVYVENKEQIDIPQMKARFSSAFFQFEETFSLDALETKTFEVNLNKEKVDELVAGPYILNMDIELELDNGKKVEDRVESTIKFLEKSGIATQESSEGWLVYRKEIEKKNEGNVPTVVEIVISKNIFSRVFTNFNIPYTRKERNGAVVKYTWQKELSPGQSLKVIANTNWFILILIAIATAAIVVLVRIYLISDIILKKNISYVQTKGGEFALKVTLRVKAKRYSENISVVDKLPPIVKLYERYGAIAPDRIDEKNRRLEWNITSLNEYEEIVLSYIVYSKIGIMGRFELPPAKAIYERNGKIKETSSNRVFFLSDRKKK